MNKKRTSDELFLALTTEANQSLAETLAQKLLQRRLAVCITLQKVQSHYWWQDELQKEEEVQLLIKTTEDQLEMLNYAIEELHSYETPEWIYWSAVSGASYGAWVKGVMSSKCM